jgi:hypothetical protein
MEIGASTPIWAAQSSWSNVRKVIAHKSDSLILNAPRFRNNALLFSSLILVLSRIGVANITAAKARGTAESSYRNREAIRTQIREIGGFTFTFVVLRAFQEVVKSLMRKSFGIKESGGPEDYPFLKNLGAALKGEQIPEEFNFKLDRPTEFKVDAGSRASQWVKGAAEWFHAKTGNGLGVGLSKTLNPEQFSNLMKHLYEFAPIVSGSIVAFLLGGFALEKFTREHSNEVVDFLSKRGNGAGQKPTALANSGYAVGLNNPSPSPESSNPFMQPVGARMDNYVTRIQQLQAERNFAGNGPTAFR